MTKKAYQKLVDQVRALPGETILAAASRCDGHTIFKSEAFLDAGLPKEVVDHLTHTHESDGSPKVSIFVNGETVKEPSGVYGLDMLRFLANALVSRTASQWAGVSRPKTSMPPFGSTSPPTSPPRPDPPRSFPFCSTISYTLYRRCPITSTKNTTSAKSAFRPVLFFVLGLALSIFGVFHTVNGYPGPDVLVRFTNALPLLGAVASFAIGVAAAVAGLVLLLPLVFRLGRRRQPRSPVYPGLVRPYADRGLPVPRPLSVTMRHDDDYGHEFDGFEDDEYRGGTGSGYSGACGGNYPSRHDDNGEYDQRRWVGSHR